MYNEEKCRLPLVSGIVVAILTLAVFVCLIWLKQSSSDQLSADTAWKQKDDVILKIALHILMFTTVLRLCLLCTIQCFYHKTSNNEKFGQGCSGRLSHFCSKWWFASCAGAEVLSLVACAALIAVPYSRDIDHQAIFFLALFLSAMASVIAISLVATAWQWVNILTIEECRIYPIGEDRVPIRV